MTTKPKATSKSALAREAKARGERWFRAACIHHGEQQHYASDRHCVVCTEERNKTTNAKTLERYRGDPEYRARWRERATGARRKRRDDPEYREAEYAKERERRTQRFASSEDFRGRKREAVAANIWRKATGGTLPGWYGLERKAIQWKYGTLPEGFEADHSVPKIAKDSEGNHVATGLHCWANVTAMPKAVNSLKRNKFSPDANRAQRPANRFPGGAFDPTPTEHERSLIRQAEALGTPAAASLAALQESLDAKAREQEQHTASLF